MILLQHALIKALRMLTERIHNEIPTEKRSKHMNEALKLIAKVLDNLPK